MSKLRRSLAAVLLGISVAATVAAQDKTPSGMCGQVKAQTAVDAAGRTATASAPLTVRLDPTDALRQEIERALSDNSTVRLSVQTVHPPPDTWSGLRIFLNAPRADLKTSDEAPQYVGDVSFYGGTAGDAATFMLDLAGAIRRLKQAGLWRPNMPLEVTLIPLPHGQKSAAGGIAVKKVSVAVPAKADQ